ACSKDDPHFTSLGIVETGAAEQPIVRRIGAAYESTEWRAPSATTGFGIRSFCPSLRWRLSGFRAGSAWATKSSKIHPPLDALAHGWWQFAGIANERRSPFIVEAECHTLRLAVALQDRMPLVRRRCVEILGDQGA